MPIVDLEEWTSKDLGSSPNRWRKLVVWLSATGSCGFLLAPFHRLRGAQRLFILFAVASFLLVIALSKGLDPRRQLRSLLQDHTRTDLDLSYPPQYSDIKDIQKSLPQHNLNLPFPEGATGRYVRFSSQVKQLGWNNVLSEL
jgi:hypothetical protein